MTKTQKGKLSLTALSLMIFTSVYGFNNIPRAFYKMGYGAIPWYILGGVLFFLPFSFMITELGTAFKHEKGGIYTWMERSVGPFYAFIGTFMWYASYLIWMVNVSNSILIPITNLVFGTTPDMSVIIISVVGILWMSIVTLASLQGLDSVKKFASIGGLAVLSLNVILIVGALIVLANSGFEPATPITVNAFFTSPAPNFQPNLVSFVAFMVFAIFAYGGVESVGGLVDQTDNPERNFPRGIITASFIITVGYSLAILCVGFFIHFQEDWYEAIAIGKINLGNVAYVLMNDLGNALGDAFGLSTRNTVFLGELFARYTGLSITFAYMGAFFTLLYAPLKQIIEGTPEKLWPKNYAKLEKGMPKTAMKAQYLIVVAITIINMLLSLVNEGAATTFFDILTNMTNVSMSLPYVFIVFAYYRFKTDDTIEKSLEIFQSQILAKMIVALVLLVVGFANFFTIIQPITDYLSMPFSQRDGQFTSAILSVISMIMGPVFFGAVAFLLMHRYRKKYPNSDFERK